MDSAMPVDTGSDTVAGASIPAAVPRAEPCACFGARADQVGVLDDAGCVLELKTGKSLQKSYALQLAGQALALNTAPTDSPARRFLLQLREDGTFTRKRDLHHYEDAADFAAVYTAAAHAHHRLRYGGRLSEESRHSFHRPDGTRVPSISAVLSLGGYVDLRDIPPAILEEKGLIGRHAHAAIEMLCTPQDGPLDTDDLEPLLAGYVLSYQRFVEATGWQVQGVEVEGVYVCPAHRP